MTIETKLVGHLRNEERNQRIKQTSIGHLQYFRTGEKNEKNLVGHLRNEERNKQKTKTIKTTSLARPLDNVVLIWAVKHFCEKEQKL